MKNNKLLFVILFALVYAVVLSFGIECLFQCIGIMGTSVFAEHSPWVYWSSFIAGILSVVALIAIFILNFNLSDKFGYNKYIWWIQSILALVLAFFLVEPWEMLFGLLQEHF
ncbi:MAG: hypothetical protein IJ404_01515 [Clostridia bacterium]|nr:hypothetical protein [Clostridia bacterium]